MSALSPISTVLGTNDWLMTPGERVALEGLLVMLKPNLAIEIGTHAGGSLERISLHSQTVHAFDLELHPTVNAERFPNVTFHIGDSHELIPAVLERLTNRGETVDFALVDGDHTAEGVRQDLEDLLASPCTAQTFILLHDTLNDSVRSGLERVDFDAAGTVCFVDFDFVPGRVMREGPQKDELWYGLGLVVTGHEVEGQTWPRAYAAPAVYDAFSSMLVDHGQVAHRLGYGQLVELQHEAASLKALVRAMERSWSWRVTAPLRRARRLARRTRQERTQSSRRN